MLDEQGVQTFFDQIHALWIGPEIENRRRANCLPAEFKIRRCLIKLPANSDPVVEFNDEIHWLATVKVSKPSTFCKGDPIFVPQIERVETVERPCVNLVPVAFVYIYIVSNGWKVIFDFSPNLPEAYAQSNSHDAWSLGESIADAINEELRERIVGMHDAMQRDIQAIGLWLAPALLLYPLSAIAEECRLGNFVAARQLLIGHCNHEFLRTLVCKWHDLKPFADRRQLFDESLSAHQAGQYTLTVSALIPHIEGVVTDWIISKLPVGTVKWRQDSKTKQLKDFLCHNGAGQSFVDRRVIEVAMNFILAGPVLADFTDWLRPIGDEFPNRHVIGHGKFEAKHYSQENSIKVFLLLDTLHHVMAGHDAKTP